jgi:hypothetical protein
MSEPGSVPPPPPPASPFNPNAIPPPQPARRGGCGKPVVIGCVSALLLAAIAALVAFYFIGKDPGRMLKWSLDRMEQGLMTTMSPEVTAEEKQELGAAFDRVRQGIDGKRIDPQRLQDINFKILELSRKGQLTSADVQDLTDRRNTLAGEGAAAEEAPPE